ncbi:MAG: GvpL/GvpF family gas vesicle protein [Acidobacteria bacterium]|nr:GvpL/GvpF family gas vesicle protein [Acidobacteriota bacterium]MBI3654839.1 GvpL/GvpF family gas vesicle protein [Acidobacteriota bacterium]
MNAEGTYIYCLIDESREVELCVPGIGDRGDPVHTIPWKGVAAVVSASPIIRYPVSKENSMAHEQAIEAAMRKGYTALPVRFGTIAENNSKIIEILAHKYDEFTLLLEQMKNKVELGVKAVFAEKIIYQDILDQYPEIRKQKAALESKGPQESYYQRIEIGRMVESALEEQKKKYREEIIAHLKSYCCDFRLTHRLLGERMIMNAAFLVDRNSELTFDQKMDELSQRYRDKVRFKYVSELPPFNFVHLVINV